MENISLSGKYISLGSTNSHSTNCIMPAFTQLEQNIVVLIFVSFNYSVFNFEIFTHYNYYKVGLDPYHILARKFFFVLKMLIGTGELQK
jgi:hypothetical protein